MGLLLLLLVGGLGAAFLVGDGDSDSADSGDANGPNFDQQADNLIVGTEGTDALFSGPGNDTIEGVSGDDRLWAGIGDDTVQAGEGDDTVRGEAGNDFISAQQGDDSVTGGLGHDFLLGGEGDDNLNATGGTNTIIGGEGNDTITNNGFTAGGAISNGGLGDDVITATGATADPLDPTDPFFNSVFGGDGNDNITVSDGDMEVYAGLGDDTITFLAGEDGTMTISGGEGNDTITADNGNGLIAGGTGNDEITLTNTGPVTTDGWIAQGGAGDDSIRFSDNATIFGNAGEDSFIIDFDNQITTSDPNTPLIGDYTPGDDVIVLEYTPSTVATELGAELDLMVTYNAVTDETVINAFGQDVARLPGNVDIAPEDISLVPLEAPVVPAVTSPPAISEPVV